MPWKLRASSPATTKTPHEPLAAPWGHPLRVQCLQPGPGSCLGTLSSLTEVAKHSSERPNHAAGSLPGGCLGLEMRGMSQRLETSSRQAGRAPAAKRPEHHLVCHSSLYPHAHPYKALFFPKHLLLPRQGTGCRSAPAPRAAVTTSPRAVGQGSGRAVPPGTFPTTSTAQCCSHLYWGTSGPRHR